MSDLQLHTINGIQLDNKRNNQKFILTFIYRIESIEK